jgi:hypothetical protein
MAEDGVTSPLCTPWEISGRPLVAMAGKPVAMTPAAEAALRTKARLVGRQPDAGRHGGADGPGGQIKAGGKGTAGGAPVEVIGGCADAVLLCSANRAP